MRLRNRAKDRFPPTRAKQTKLFLRDGELSPTPATAEKTVSYDAEDGHAKFRYTFDRDTEISGYMALRLWLEADGSDDMDIAVSMRERPGLLARMKEALPGPPDGNASSALMRVSFRELDAERSTPAIPVLAMRREMRLKPGEVVPVDIALSPMALFFHKGEEIEVTVGAFRYPPFIPFTFGEAKVPFPIDGLTFPPGSPGEISDFFGPKEPSATRLATTPPSTRNKGRHILHLGGSYDSHLSVFEVQST